MRKWFLQILTFVVLADGVMTALFGHNFVRLYRIGPPDSAFRRIIEWFLRWPGWLLRAGASGQAALGAAAFRRTIEN